MMEWFENVWLNLFNHHSFCGNTMCIVGASGFAEDCGISSMGGSRHPTHSPLLNVICLLVLFDIRIFTDVFPLMLWMPLVMFMLGSFPFVES